MSIKIKESAPYDVIGIGSALLDFTVNVSDEFLKDNGLKKGEMHLIDKNRSSEIRSLIKGFKPEITPGGSSANTMAGIQNFGGKSIFNGRAGHDNYGDLYIKETEKAGVKASIVKDKESATGHAVTFITPDSERTFATHLGAAINFDINDVYEEGIKMSKILHLEGYLLEPPGVYEAALKAMDIAVDNNVLISIDMSDPALIERIYDRFKMVVTRYASIVFANEDEAKMFTGQEERNALAELSGLCRFAVVKLGDRGSIIGSGGSVYEIPVYNADVVNTNGAGDIYAAGVLFGISGKYDPVMCGKLGSYAASRVVARSGARISEKIEINDL